MANVMACVVLMCGGLMDYMIKRPTWLTLDAAKALKDAGATIYCQLVINAPTVIILQRHIARPYFPARVRMWWYLHFRNSLDHIAVINITLGPELCVDESGTFPGSPRWHMQTNSIVTTCIFDSFDYIAMIHIMSGSESCVDESITFPGSPRW